MKYFQYTRAGRLGGTILHYTTIAYNRVLHRERVLTPVMPTPVTTCAAGVLYLYHKVHRLQQDQPIERVGPDIHSPRRACHFQ